MNRSGQAMIEALIGGTLCIMSLYFIFTLGMKIIQTVTQEEKLEELYIKTQ